MPNVWLFGRIVYARKRLYNTFTGNAHLMKCASTKLVKGECVSEWCHFSHHLKEVSAHTDESLMA